MGFCGHSGHKMKSCVVRLTRNFAALHIPRTRDGPSSGVKPLFRTVSQNCSGFRVFPGLSLARPQALVQTDIHRFDAWKFFQSSAHGEGAGHSIHAEDGEIHLQKFRLGLRHRAEGERKTDRKTVS